MPVFEYVLLALIGSGGLGTPTTVGAEAIVQPNGGTLVAMSEPTKKEGRHQKIRHGRHHKRRHNRRLEDGKDKKGSKRN